MAAPPAATRCCSCRLAPWPVAAASFRPNVRLDSVRQRQLFSAIGQVKLMDLYYDLFREYNIHIGQVLTMKENFATRNRYLNQRACLTVMLESGVVPIINENDTVSVTELMFTDNDELAGLVAAMMNAQTLIILSNIDGLYNGNPKDEGTSIIPIVDYGNDINQYVQATKSGFGRGGMKTKAHIATKVAEEGIKVIIANGQRDHVLTDLAERPSDVPHTEFRPNPNAASGIKKWIAHSESLCQGTRCGQRKGRTGPARRACREPVAHRRDRH